MCDLQVGTVFPWKEGIMRRLTTGNKLPLIKTNLERLKVKKMFKLGNRSKERLKGVDSRIIEIIEFALTISNVDFGIPQYGGLRDLPTQKLLFDKRRSKCDGINNKSAHQSGLAFDIFAYVDGSANYDRYNLTQVAAAILQAAALLGHELEWGGLWKGFVDMPHFQLKL